MKQEPEKKGDQRHHPPPAPVEPTEIPGLHMDAIPGERTCPYCKDTLQDRGRVCCDCGVHYHMACWTALGSCATLGCSSQQSKLVQLAGGGREKRTPRGVRLRHALGARRVSFKAVSLGFLVLGAMGFAVGQLAVGGQLRGGPILWGAWVGFFAAGLVGAWFGARESE